MCCLIDSCDYFSPFSECINIKLYGVCEGHKNFEDIKDEITTKKLRQHANDSCGLKPFDKRQRGNFNNEFMEDMKRRYASPNIFGNPYRQ